jgi:hypothetical protein
MMSWRSYSDLIAYLPHAVPSIGFGVCALLLTLFLIQRAIPRGQWQFGRMKDGQLVPDISAPRRASQHENRFERCYTAGGAAFT